ncbi:MAG: PDZ domain-containing protein [Oscillospiraceae bacterium]|nr:PDZ domain-containing protein [Oscillospiraceae bacterium]
MKKIGTCLILMLLLLYTLPQTVLGVRILVPVGTVVGLELHNNTVTVAAFDDASQARTAGLEVGDQLLAIDGRSIHCTEDVRTALDRSDGTVEVTVVRGKTRSTVRIAPTITDDGPKLGIYLRQGVTGIGTITYYDPETKIFGTLGHGVNDPDGSLLSLTQGSAYEARVVNVRKGRSGQPGQLIGSLCGHSPMGALYRNTARGVFGTTDAAFDTDPLPIGTADTVRTGSATIRSTVAGNTPREYSVEILKVYPAARTNGRNMLIRVTDPTLLEATGGIVQGMSGSPIIQDGKLVGAVTHVLVNDPTMGYGIFIENMLDAAA